MTQMICRIDSNCPDMDVLCVEDGAEIWKSVSAKNFAFMVDDICSEQKGTGEKPKWIPAGILAIGDNSMVIRKEKHKQIVSYQGKAYEINFPDAVYLVTFLKQRIQSICAYTYFDWQGINTRLYNMPMPNMTKTETMCIGSGDRHIDDGDVMTALDRILDAEYTHDHVDNLRNPTSTLKWFRFLKNGTATEKMMREQKKVFLRDLVSGGPGDA